MNRNPMATILIVLMAAACSQSDGGRHRFTVRTIDGVRNAVNTGGPKYPEPLFELEKILVLNQDPEVEESLLYRSGMFLRAENGKYYVADSGAHRIAVYDSAGNYEFCFGQQGFGPGDFSMIGGLTLIGDEVQVFDMQMTRISRFTLTGRLIDVVSSPLNVAPIEGFLSQMYVTENGQTVVIAQQEDYRSDYIWKGQLGSLYSPQKEVIRTVQTEWACDQKILSLGDDQFTTANRQFAAAPQVLFSEYHGFVYGTGLEPVLNCTSLDGRETRMCFELEQRPVTAEDRARTRATYDELIAAAEGIRQADWRAQKDALEWPEYRPCWMRFSVDDAGFIWLMAYETYAEVEAAGKQRLYYVLSPEGELLGQARLPGFLGGQILNNGYLTVNQHDLDSGEVFPTVYRLRPAAPGFSYP